MATVQISNGPDRPRFIVLFLVLLAALLEPSAGAQTAPNLERGFSPDKVFQFGDLDSVSLLNGNLNIRIPLGMAYPVGPSLTYQLALVYNSKAWDFLPAGDYSKAVSDQFGNAGMGWRLSLGRLFDPNDAWSEPNGWVYVSPDGAEHGFSPNLHADGSGESACDTQTCYSRDGNYLRLRVASATVRWVDLPDGTSHRFEKMDYGGSGYEWRLTAISDRFGSDDDVHIDYIGFPNDTAWQVKDRIGRSQVVTFEADPAWSDSKHRRVTSVSLRGFGGTNATYNFIYRDGASATSVEVPCGSTLPTWATAPTSLLTQISLPDQSTFAMVYPTSRAASSNCWATGLITKLSLPTGGSINWTYNLRVLPLSGCSRRRDWHSQSAAVASRTLRNASGGDLAKWTYSGALSAKLTAPQPYSCPGGGNPQSQNKEEELKVYVGTPGGDTEVYYFSVYPDPAAPGAGIPYSGLFRKDEFGLPFSRAVNDGDQVAPRYLSKEVLDCTGGTNCSVVRQTFVRYEYDPSSNCGSNAEIDDCMTTNRRLAATRVVYRNDPKPGCVWPGPAVAPSVVCNASWEDSTDFDDYGHYRRTTLGATFGPATTKTITTQYTPDASNWLLETFSSKSQAQGSSVEVQKFTFDPATGFMRCVRRRANAATDSNKDVLIAYQADSAGFPLLERWFGGDDNTAPNQATCDPLALGAKYSYSHVTGEGSLVSNPVQLGSRKTTVTVGGIDLAIEDVDLDPYTGLPLASRDTAGVTTQFNYDWRGFLTRQQRAGQEPVVNAICMPGASAGPDCTEATSPPQILSRVGDVTAFEKERWTFDGIGRLKRQERQRPGGGGWDGRDILYDSGGRKSFEGEWGKAAPFGTSYTGYDPFGRPGAVTRADGTFTTFTYSGVSSSSRENRVWNGSTNELAKTVEFYDRDGRLFVIKEPNGTRTRYLYDVAGRLISVNQNIGASAQQNRRFFYDGRGFLDLETHPESGTTSYRYDVKGNVVRSIRGDGQAGAAQLDYVYDEAGQLSKVRSPSNVVLREYFYGTVGSTKGKLTQEWAYNWRPAGSPAVCTNFKVEEEYTYGGTHGFIDHKTTSLFEGTTPKESFQQGYTYDGAGRITTLDYPQCVGSACSSTPRPLTTVYSYGRPIQVSGFASNIAYNANGTVSSVSHTNGVVDLITTDASGLPRPAAISAKLNGSFVWPQQEYVYDPSGNITKIGTSSFVYDKLSRLTGVTIPDVPVVPGVTHYTHQEYSYDVFGNITQVSFGDPVVSSSIPYPTSTATSRLTSGSYNARGSLTGYSGSTYTWDRFDNLASVNTGSENWTHTYDASDERIWSWRTSSTRVDTVAVRDLRGSVLRKFKREGSVFNWEDYVYRDGLLLAGVVGSVGSSDQVRHFHLDHLGTVRRISDVAGAVTVHDMWPFGDEFTTVTDGEQFKFAGHERDLGVVSATADDIDYMHARHYRPLFARFLSPDMGGWDAGAPQSWNRYSYVLGNPVRNVDLDGQSATDVLEDVRVTLPAFPALAAIGGAVIEGPALVVGGVAGGLGLGTGFLITKIPGWNEAVTSPVVSEALSNLILSVSGSKADDASLTTGEMAKGVAEKAGANRASATTAGGVRVDIDLTGKPHFDKATKQDVTTPHVHETKLHVGPNGQVNAGRTDTRPATKQDVRTAERILKRN